MSDDIFILGDQDNIIPRLRNNIAKYKIIRRFYVESGHDVGQEKIQQLTNLSHDDLESLYYDIMKILRR